MTARSKTLYETAPEGHKDAPMATKDTRSAVSAPDSLSRPLRLFVNGLHSKSGGGVTYLRNVLPLLGREQDLDVHLCILENQRDLLPAELNAVTVHSLPYRGGFFGPLIYEQTIVPRLARRIGADVTFSPANYGPLLAPNPVILIRNAISVAFVERRITKLLYWAGVYAATALSLLTCRQAIAVSGYARRSVASGVLKHLRKRMTVVWHGVGPAFSPPPDGAAREDFVLAVSDVYVQKNLRNLIHAIGRLRPYHPDIRLKIAGAFIDREYYDSLRRLIDKRNLAGHVEFLGHVPLEGLLDLYRRCAVFVFPSTVETFGNPLVEAMACGAPIASSNTAAMPEVLEDAGLFFEPDDVDGIAVAINRFLRNPDIGQVYSDKAVARARAFSWERTVADTVAVIRSAANSASYTKSAD
jgi:glycosyltransferase involved in cell wall biosynthesis